MSWRRVGCTFLLRWRALMCVRLGPCQVFLVMYHRLVLYSALAIASPRVSPGRHVELGRAEGTRRCRWRSSSSELGCFLLTQHYHFATRGSLRETENRSFAFFVSQNSSRTCTQRHRRPRDPIRIPGLLQGRFGAYQKPCRCHTAPPPAPTGGRVRGARRRSTDTRLASGRAESTAKRKAQYRTSIHATRRYMRDKRATGADRVRRAAHTASAPNHIPQSEAGYAWPPQTRPNFATSSPARSSQVWRRI